jgi:hypothetical protein
MLVVPVIMHYQQRLSDVICDDTIVVLCNTRWVLVSVHFEAWFGLKTLRILNDLHKDTPTEVRTRHFAGKRHFTASAELLQCILFTILLLSNNVNNNTSFPDKIPAHICFSIGANITDTNKILVLSIGSKDGE